MDWVVTSLVLVALVTIDGALGDTMVSGTVFCDQCKDGEITVLDYPLGGVRVLMTCPGENGQFTVLREETTNWLGAFTTSFAGILDMGSCRAQISGNGQGCGAAGGPAQDFKLMFKMFDNQMYRVDPLVAQPITPSPFCRRPSSSPDPHPPPPHLNFPPLTPWPPMPPLSPLPPPLPPLSPLPPLLPPLSPLPPLPPRPQLPPLSPFSPPLTQLPAMSPSPDLPTLPPTTQLPALSPSHDLPPLSPPMTQLPPLSPLPKLPPVPPLPPMPPEPLFNSSACSYQMWMMPQHKCYWNVLSPNLTIALVFGPLASTQYGTNITLHQSMYGRGEPYRTLLREGTTALLNSYTSNQFVYQPQDIVRRLNLALMSESTYQVLVTGYKFIKANSGEKGNTTCKFSDCASSHI